MFPGTTPNKLFHYSLLLAPLFLACAPQGRTQSPSSRLVHTAEVDLAYDALGSGTKLPPIIAVNGGPGLTHAYMVQNNIWERLAQNRQVIFYDQRGNGRSIRLASNAPQTMVAQVADLEAIRVSLHAETIDLVGDSFGGFIVLAYTLAHPDHVHRLVVSDGLPGWKAIVHPMPDIFPDIDAQAEARMKILPKGKEADEYNLRAHLRKCFYSPELADRYLSHFHDLGFNAAVSDQVNAATQDLDLSSELKKISTPTLILTGRFNVNVAPMTAWRMANAIPHAQLHIFET
ncbi:MAG: alpha/beta fold hydrolase [Janthinobacterium lividum]